MSAPPAAAPGDSRSPRKATPSPTVTTGSSVESTAACVGPTRRSPATKAAMATTVPKSDSASIAPQPPAPCGQRTPCHIASAR